MTCTEYNETQRFYALEAPLIVQCMGRRLCGLVDPHLSLGYRVNEAFGASDVVKANKALRAMRAASHQWDVDGSNVVLIDCSEPIADWSVQVDLLKRK